MRLHASRGSMSLGESAGGLPPDSVVDSEEKILADSERLIRKYHDPKPGSMLQIVLAPCSPFSVTGALMKQSAVLAREHGVHLHTHLAETQDEEVFCQEKFGYRPVGYMQSLDWVGEDVWFAHSVHVSPDEIQVYAREGCGAAHCPSSNMRLASGIAPVVEFLKAGVKVGLGVDGSASNDGSHMLAEARMAMLLARLGSGLKGASLSSTGGEIFTARHWNWPRAVAPRCLAGRTSGHWTPENARISLPSTSAAWITPGRCMTRWRRWCCVSRAGSTTTTSMAEQLSSTGSLPCSSCLRISVCTMLPRQD